jgi:hypothetical protein
MKVFLVKKIPDRQNYLITPINNKFNLPDTFIPDRQLPAAQNEKSCHINQES